MSGTKTFKREAAIGSLLFLGYVAGHVLWNGDDVALEVFKILTPPTFLFATAMFGADWHGKQSKWSMDIATDETDVSYREETRE